MTFFDNSTRPWTRTQNTDWLEERGRRGVMESGAYLMELKCAKVYIQGKCKRIFFLALQCDTTVLSMPVYHARLNSTPSDGSYVTRCVSFTLERWYKYIHTSRARPSNIRGSSFGWEMRVFLSFERNVIICDIYATNDYDHARQQRWLIRDNFTDMIRLKQSGNWTIRVLNIFTAHK